MTEEENRLKVKLQNNNQVKLEFKILCFHGYRQSAEIFQKKSGAFRKALKSRAKFEFISAPFPINSMVHNSNGGGDEEENEKKEIKGRAWWFSNREQRSFSSREVCTFADGFEESIKYTLEFIKNKVI
uniref:FSH1 domain-containing protein n=1 Tax=Meloidogyne hapla TaxID=6305 RepID=A0A1I8B3Z0_MELHA